MGFINIAEGVVAVKKRAGGAAKPKLGIFDSSKQRVLEDLALSITHAKGRFEGAEEGASDKAYASRCWRAEYVTDKNKNKKLRTHSNGDELIKVYIKCKGKKISGLLVDDEGNDVDELQLASRDVIAQLENIQTALEGMEKGTALGDYWHDNAVRNSLPPAEFSSINTKTGMPKDVSHCLEADKWVENKLVSKSSPYPSQNYS